MLRQHGHRGWPGAAGDGRDRASDIAHGVGLHVAERLTLGRHIGSEVDHHSTRLDVPRPDQVGTAGGDTQQVGLTRDLLQIGRARVAHAHRRIGVDQQQRQRHTHHRTAADDDGARAAQANAVVLHEANSAQGSGRRQRRPALSQTTEVLRVLTVDVFVGIEGESRGLAAHSRG